MARTFDGVGHLIELVPIVLAGKLEMIDLSGSTACLGDIDRFLESGFDAVTLTAHVSCVDAAATGRLLSESNEFRCLGVTGGGIDEHRSEAQRPLLHCLVNQRLHLFQLLW